MLDMFKRQWGGPCGLRRGTNVERSRSCDQGGNWGQGADVFSLADYFPGLWLFLLNVEGCWWRVFSR